MRGNIFVLSFCFALAIIAGTAGTGLCDSTRLLTVTPYDASDVLLQGADDNYGVDVTDTGDLVVLVPSGDQILLNLYNDAGILVRTLSTFGQFLPETVIFGSFVRIAPDGETVYCGITESGSVNDGIFTVPLDAVNETATLAAGFPGNYDLEFALVDGEPVPFVSGLNSTLWDAPNSVWLLDTSGADAHNKIAELGGYSAGVAYDSAGNLYCPSNGLLAGDLLVSFAAADVAWAIEEGPEKADQFLELSDGSVLSLLEGGAADAVFDAAGSLYMAFNVWGGDLTVARIVKSKDYSGYGDYKYDVVGTGGQDAFWFNFLARGPVGLIYMAPLDFPASITRIEIPCTDLDADGYAIEGDTCGEIDCDDLNPNANPGQEEIPDNGIDDDCDGVIDANCFIRSIL